MEFCVNARYCGPLEGCTGKAGDRLVSKRHIKDLRWWIIGLVMFGVALNYLSRFVCLALFDVLGAITVWVLLPSGKAVARRQSASQGIPQVSR